MRNFGQYFSILHMSKMQFEVINQYHGAGLYEIAINQYMLSNDHIHVLGVKLAKLARFPLGCCSFQTDINASVMFPLCSNLGFLGLWRLDLETQRNFLIRENTPTLRTFHVDSCVIENETIVRFLKSNPQLTDIRIISCELITTRVIRSIVELVPRLTCITFKYNSQTDIHLESEKHLKYLTELYSLDLSLYYDWLPVMSELALTRVPLRRLVLRNFFSNERLVTAISGMKKIEMLKFSYALRIALSDIVQIIINLEMLTVEIVRCRLIV